MTDSPTVVTLIARRNLRLIFPLTPIEERDARHEAIWISVGEHGSDADFTSVRDNNGPDSHS